MKHEQSDHIKNAVMSIAMTLPDRNADRVVVLETAIEKLNGEVSDSTVHILQSLVHASPQCYGSERSKKWVGIVRIYLAPKEILYVYLKCFPEKITLKQRESIKRFLLTKLCPELCAVAILEHNIPRESISDDPFGVLSPVADARLSYRFGYTNRVQRTPEPYMQRAIQKVPKGILRPYALV